MSSPFTAVYDACVLYPAPLRDFLMWLGLLGRFRARWSPQIHDEWKRNLLLNRPDLTRAQLDRTSGLMDLAIPDGLVIGHETLIAGLNLPDVDDRHVLTSGSFYDGHPRLRQTSTASPAEPRGLPW
jgi:hypothetical protein